MSQEEKQHLFNSDAYNATTRASQTWIEEWNASHNLAPIEKLIAEGRCKDISDAPHKNGEPCFVIGSGGSLDIALPKLKEWKGGIICTPTQGLTFIHEGIEPDYLFIIDPYNAYDEIAGVDWSKTKTKLITTPTCDCSIIANWPNDIILYVQDIARRDAFYTNTMQHMYCKREGFKTSKLTMLVYTKISAFACSPAIEVLAVTHLGYNNIFLAGCDFCYTYDKDRYSDWTIKDGIWEKHDYPYRDIDDAKKKEHFELLGFNGKKFITWPLALFYKKGLISACRKYVPSIYTTDKGLITELPYLDIDYVIKKQGQHIKGVSYDDRAAMSENYLASVDSYIIEAAERGNNGLIFIDCNLPDPIIRQYMIGMKSVYGCTACGNIEQLTDKCPKCGLAFNDFGACKGTLGLTVNEERKVEALACDYVITESDLKDHTGEKCSKCQNPTMIKEFDVDIPKNMERVMKLYHKHNLNVKKYEVVDK